MALSSCALSNCAAARGYFNGIKCSGAADVFHAPAELEFPPAPTVRRAADEGCPAEGTAAEEPDCLPEGAQTSARAKAKQAGPRKSKGITTKWPMVMLVGLQG